MIFRLRIDEQLSANQISERLCESLPYPDMRARNTFQNYDEVKLLSLPVKIGNEDVIVALHKRAVAAVEIQLA